MSGKAQPRRASKVDGNAETIFGWLREAGALVYPVGYPFDALVGNFGRWDPVEIKLPDGTVKQSQVKALVEIAAAGLPPVILASDAETIITEQRRRAKAAAR